MMRLNILFVLPQVDGMGGREKVLHTLAIGLKQYGHEINILILGRKRSVFNSEWRNGLAIFEVNYPPRFVRFLDKLVERLKIRDVIKSCQPDVVIALNDYTVYLVAQAKKSSDMSFILFSWPHENIAYSRHVDRFKLADFHFALSAGIFRGLIKLDIPSNDIFLIGNPVTLGDKIIPRPSCNAPKVFLYIGRFAPEKDLTTLIKAFANLEGNWELHLIGDGPERFNLEDSVYQKGLANRVLFHGWILDPWKYVYENLKEVTSLILTSKYEGFALVLMEALSRGIFCITSRFDDGIDEMSKLVLSFPVGDVNELTSKLELVVTEKYTLPDQEELKKFSEQFEPKKYIERVHHILVNVTK